MLPDAYARIAGYYDAAYHAAELQDLSFYTELAGARSGPVLEIACGTGRVLLEIARLGKTIHGLDFCEEFLAILRQKLTAEPQSVSQRVTLHKADMRSFRIAQTFDLVIMPFRPMQHLYTLDDQITALSRARQHLARGGVLAFDVFFPDVAMLQQASGEEMVDLEWQDELDPDVRVQRSFVRHRLDRLNQFYEGEFIFRTFRRGRIIKEDRAPLKMSYYSYPQLCLLFRQCGLGIVEQYGTFDKQPIDVCKEMIFVLEPSRST